MCFTTISYFPLSVSKINLPISIMKKDLMLGGPYAYLNQLLNTDYYTSI